MKLIAAAHSERIKNKKTKKNLNVHIKYGNFLRGKVFNYRLSTFRNYNSTLTYLIATRRSLYIYIYYIPAKRNYINIVTILS